MFSHLARNAPKACRAFCSAVTPQLGEAFLWRNPAAVLVAPNDLRFEDWPLPTQLAPNDVRVEMRSVGICGSDVHYWKKGRIAHFEVVEPMILGHESAGRVVEAGTAVTHLKEGDRVALEPGIPCWSSGIARKGRYNLDPNVRFRATPPHHGSLAQYVDHSADFCYKLPADVTYEEGALAEPLSVGIHACRRGNVGPGKTVGILGAGPIGLMTLMAARAFGADAVAVTDLNDFNLDKAEDLGADVTFLPRADMTPDDVAQQLRHMVQARGLDVVIDCAGFESTIQTALKSASCGGKVVLVGFGQTPCCVDLHASIAQEVDLLGSWRYANTYPLAIRLMETKRVEALRLITHRFGFSAQEVQQAFDVAAQPGAHRAIKVMFDMS